MTDAELARSGSISTPSIAAKPAGVTLEYVEVPGGSHVYIAAPNFGAMFDFFADQARE